MPVILEKYSKASMSLPMMDEKPNFHPVLVGWLSGILKSQSKIDVSAQPSLRDTFLALNQDQKQLLIKKLGEVSLQTIFSLSLESDPKIFGHRFFALGQAFLKQGKADLASSIFSSISQNNRLEPPLIQQAQHQLNIIQGTTSILNQTEYVLHQSFHSLWHPSPWLGFAAGLPLFKVGKGFFLPFVLSGPGKGLVTTQLGATVASTLFGFSLEAYGFAAASKIGHHWMGTNTDGKLLPTGKEAVSSAGMLGPMKGVGATAVVLLGAPGKTALHRFYQTTIHQGATMGGIFMGHGLETYVGLKEPQPFNKTIAETAGLLGSFWVMGQFSPWMMGRGAQNYLQGVDHQTKMTLERGPRWNFLNLEPKKALAFANSAPVIHERHVQETRNDFMAMAKLDGRNFPHLRMGIRSAKETIVHEEAFQRRLSADHLRDLLPNGKVIPARVKDSSYVTGVLDGFSITSHLLDIASFREGYKIGRDFPERVGQTAFDIDEVYLHWAISARGLFRGMGEKGKNATFRNTPAEFLNYEPFVSSSEARLPFFGKIWFDGIHGLLKGRMRQHLQFHPGVRAFQLGLRLGQDKNLIMATTGAAGRIMILANEDPAMRMIYFGKGPEETVSIEEVRQRENIYTREHLVLAMREVLKEGNPLLLDPLVQDYIQRIRLHPKKGEKLKHPAIAKLLHKREFSTLVDDSSSTYKMLKDLPGFSVLQPPSTRPKLTLNFVLFRSGRYLDKMTNHYVPSLADSLSQLNLTSQPLQIAADTPVDYPHQRFDLEISWQRYGREFNLPGQELKLLSQRLQKVGK